MEVFRWKVLVTSGEGVIGRLERLYSRSSRVEVMGAGRWKEVAQYRRDRRENKPENRIFGNTWGADSGKLPANDALTGGVCFRRGAAVLSIRIVIGEFARGILPVSGQG